MRKKFDLLGISEMEWGAGRRGGSLGPAALHFAALEGGWDMGYGRAPIHLRAPYTPAHKERPSAYYLHEFAGYYPRLSMQVREYAPGLRRFLWLSGDHSSTPGWFHGLRHAFPERRWAMVWIDAHADLHTPYTSPSLNVHGMTVAMMMNLIDQEEAIRQPTPEMVRQWERILTFCRMPDETPLLSGADLLYVGLRSVEPQEKHLISRERIEGVWLDDPASFSVEAVLAHARKKFAGCDALFISFDIDVIDKTLVPGTGTPEPGGITWEQARRLLQGLYAMHPMVALEVVELNPLLDVQNQTADRMAEVLKSVFIA